MERKIIFFLFFNFLMGIHTISIAQELGEEPEGEEEKIVELITSGIISYSPAEETSRFGTEIHLAYWVAPKWAAGFSYSAKFEEDKVLSDIALLASTNPTRWLTVNVGPNFAFPNGELRESFILGLYTETELNWRVTESFHFGLLLGTVLSEETELSTGIQMGFEF